MLARMLGGVGRVLVTAGTLILLFVVYQLWGTNLQTAKSQKALGSEFNRTLATAPTTTSTTTTTTTLGPAGSVTVPLVPVATAPADLPLPHYGDAIAEIQIPKIGVDNTVVEGVGLDQLKRGPGHYQETPLPGQKGNAAIAGHRTTYGAPFHNVDKLANGDQIIVKTVQGTFVYEVDRVEVVKPSDVSVLADKGDNRITLTACHPKYSLKERIIVSGVLKGAPAPEISGQAKARAHVSVIPGDEGAKTAATIDGALSGTTKPKTPAIVWGLVCAAIWAATWAASKLVDRRTGRRKRNRHLVIWSPYLIGVPVFLVALYIFFENFAVFLPANF